MTAIKRKYWVFYVQGRQERRLRFGEVLGAGIPPEEAIAKRVLDRDNASLRDVTREACEEAAKSSLTDRVRRRWIADHDEQIRKSGADPSEAYEAWCTGRIDELAFIFEPEVLSVLEEELLEGDDEDEG